MTSSLNSYSQSSLVLCAGAGDSSGKNLTSLGYVSLKLVNILVIDAVSFLLSTENANLLSSADYSLSHRSIALVTSVGLLESHYGVPPI